MSSRTIVVRVVTAVTGIGAMLAVVWLLSSLKLIPSEISPTFIYEVIMLLGLLLLLRSISGQVLKMLIPKIGQRAFSVVNIFKILGYILLGIATLSLLGISPEAALVGGTFSGLVLGLGAQPLLSNLFAGIVVLLTGFIKVGDEVRISTNSIPYQWAFLPGYKYFSPDYIYVGYRGQIVEVGLFYSTLVTDTGLELRVPNSVVLNSAIVDYTPAHSSERKYQVRYEFKNDLDPDVVLEKVKEALSDIPEVKLIIINEQSDKEYYIVLLEFYLKIDRDWKQMKSEILRRIIKVHRTLMQAGTS